MCTKLTQNGQVLLPGNKAVVRTPKGERILTWGLNNDLGLQANARLESIDKWRKKGFKQNGILEVDSFYEGTTNFKFPKKGELGVIYRDDVFLLVTEPANAQVSKVHHRQPCINLLKLVA